ncbi:MAG TPA: outer membrane beta-barrel protein [Candidatus Acidoferrum sp.]|jgi:hypothetical protein
MTRRTLAAALISIPACLPCAAIARLAALLLLLGAAGSPARAQWTPYATPEFEASGAFSYARAHSANSSAFNLIGGSGEFAYHLRHWLALAADGGAYRFQGLPSGITSNLYTYAGGPRITFRNHRYFTPFAQALIGGGRLTAESGGLHAGENSVVFLGGLGVDLPISHGFAIRAGQVDYLLTRFARIDGSGATQNNLRVSFGVVLRFGDKE